MRITRALAVAALAVAITVSCPNPIDDDLLRIVEDVITPSLTIAEPSESYYHGTMHVSGFILDSSITAGDGNGRLHTLTFSVSNDSLLNRTITFNTNGTFTVEPPDSSFVWDPVTGGFQLDCEMGDLTGYRLISIVVTDANGNQTQKDRGLMPYPYGPHLVLTKPDTTTYDLTVDIEGTVTNSTSDDETDEIKALSWEGGGESGELVLECRHLGRSEQAGTNRAVSGTTRRDDIPRRPGYFAQERPHRVEGWRAESFTHVDLHHRRPVLQRNRAGYHHPQLPGSVLERCHPNITVTGRVEDMADLEPGSMIWKARHPPDAWQTAHISDPDVLGIFSFTFDPVDGDPALSGDLTIEVSALDPHGVPTVKYLTCYDDTDPPAAPTVTGETPTNDRTPTWNWNVTAETVEFRIDDPDSTPNDWVSVDMATSWTSSTLLDEGDHTLYVQGRDALGNWSDSGSRTVEVDTTPPLAPDVTSPETPTYDSRPTWSWNVPEGTVEFHCSLNSDSGPWTTLGLATSWTPSAPFNEGYYTLYVQGRDAAGNWSSSGSFRVHVLEH